MTEQTAALRGGETTAPRADGVLRLVKRECANFIAGKHFGERPCRLRAPGARCPYFEKAVLPLADRLPEYAGLREVYWQSAAKAQGLEPKAVSQVQDARQSTARTCADCGAPAGRRRQYCEDCRRRRRRASEREARRRGRSAVGDATGKWQTSPEIGREAV